MQLEEERMLIAWNLDLSPKKPRYQLISFHEVSIGKKS